MGLPFPAGGLLRGRWGEDCSGVGAEPETEELGISAEFWLRVRETGAQEGRAGGGPGAPLPGGACGPIPQALVQTPGFVTS